MHTQTQDITEEVITIIESQVQALSDAEKLTLRSWLNPAIDHHVQLACNEAEDLLRQQIKDKLAEVL